MSHHMTQSSDYMSHHMTQQFYSLREMRASTLALVTQLCVTLCDPIDLWPARLLCPWNSPGKNTAVGSHFLLQGLFLTQGSNPRSMHWQAGSLPLSHHCKVLKIKPKTTFTPWKESYDQPR